MRRRPANASRREIQEAADPTTPGPRLQQFWDLYRAHYRRRQSSEVVRPSTPLELALAGNPNTPPEVLRDLAEQCPSEVVRNVAFPLVLIVDPGFFHSVDCAALYRLLRRADTPAVALGSLQHHPYPEIAEEARWHVGLHGEAVPDLDATLDQIRRNLARTYTDGLDELLALDLVPEPIMSLVGDVQPLTYAEAPKSAAALSFGEIPPTEPERLLRWLLKGPASPKPAPAQDAPVPRSPLEAALLEHGLDTWNVEARKCVAGDAEQTAEVLEILAGHRLPAVRARVAANPSAPVTAIERLSHATLPYELCPLASNPSTPIEVLVRLSRHEWVEVSGSTLLSPRLPRAEVDRLAQHREPWVRARAAQHPACSPETLIHLAGDVSRVVRRSVAAAPTTPLGAAERMRAPALREARHSDPLSRWIAHSHPEIPAAALTEAAHSEWWYDRLAAALHPATPARDRAQLIDDSNALVRAAARATMAHQEVDSHL